MSFTGGKLKLKGGEPLKGSIDKKKKRKKSASLVVADTEDDTQEQQVLVISGPEFWAAAEGALPGCSSCNSSRWCSLR